MGNALLSAARSGAAQKLVLLFLYRQLNAMGYRIYNVDAEIRREVERRKK